MLHAKTAFTPSMVAWHRTIQHAATVLDTVHTAQCTIVPMPASPGMRVPHQ